MNINSWEGNKALSWAVRKWGSASRESPAGWWIYGMAQALCLCILNCFLYNSSPEEISSLSQTGAGHSNPVKWNLRNLKQASYPLNLATANYVETYPTVSSFHILYLPKPLCYKESMNKCCFQTRLNCLSCGVPGPNFSSSINSWWKYCCVLQMWNTIETWPVSLGMTSNSPNNRVQAFWIHLL